MSEAKARDAAYRKVIGKEFDTHVDDSAKPRIEVRRYRGTPVKGEPACDVWVTAGMSDVDMIDDEGDELRRELIFYAPPGGDYVQALLAVARFPFEHETMIDHAHTVRSYGALFTPGGAEALASDDPSRVPFPHVALLAPLLRQHRALGDELEIEDVQVEFLWVVPITQAELDLKNTEGMDALLDLFETKKHPWLFNPARKSYV